MYLQILRKNPQDDRVIKESWVAQDDSHIYNYLLILNSFLPPISPDHPLLPQNRSRFRFWKS